MNGTNLGGFPSEPTGRRATLGERSSTKGQPLTVCIAAICRLPDGRAAVIAASDRMLTSDDIEFEPPQTKVYHMAMHTVVLVAGDTSPQITICDRTYRSLAEKPTLIVEEIAERYATNLMLLRREEAERRILHPQGLDLKSFVRQQTKMSPALVNDLSAQLGAADLGVAGIIAGLDVRGPHIYVVSDPGVVACNDAMGFAAIGWGGRHAESQFMLAQYSKNWLVSRALFLIYSAKRRAELAPSVGQGTDIYAMTTDGGYFQLDQATIAPLEIVYKESREEHEKVTERSQQKVQQLWDEMLKKPPTPQTPTP